VRSLAKLKLGTPVLLRLIPTPMLLANIGELGLLLDTPGIPPDTLASGKAALTSLANSLSARE